MSVLYISEYPQLARGRSSDILFGVAPEPPLAEQTVAIGVAAQSAAFNAETRFIRIHVDEACSILIGTNPAATTAHKRLAADQTEYFGVTPGAKLSVIANA